MDQFLDLAVRYYGTEKGFIVGSEGESYAVEKEGSLSDNSGASNSESFVRYVLKTGESVILVNALHSSYSADPLFVETSPNPYYVCLFFSQED